VIDRVVELQAEEGIPVHVIPVRAAGIQDKIGNGAPARRSLRRRVSSPKRRPAHETAG
jgi:hypothetical protein